jgi:hypothetical protein
VQKKLRVLDLFKHISDAPNWKKITAILLAMIYGLAVPFGTVALKERALSGEGFLFLSNLEIFPLASVSFWICCLFCAAVSLFKVYEFLVAAFRNKLVALLSCIGFEFAFITSTNWFGWLGFFFLVIAIANVVQASAGFIVEEDEEKELQEDPVQEVKVGQVDQPEEKEEFVEKALKKKMRLT